jgi:hypothetical protein
MERYPLEIELYCPTCRRKTPFRFIEAGYNIVRYGCLWCGEKIDISKSELEKHVKKPSAKTVEELTRLVEDIDFAWGSVEATIEAELNDATLYLEAVKVGKAIRDFLYTLKKWRL